MRVVHLPAGVVWVLNSLSHGLPLDEPLQAYTVDRAGAEEFLVRESQFSVDETEAAQLDTLAYLWETIDQKLDSSAHTLDFPAEVGELSKLFFEAAAIMEKLERGRARGVYSPQPAVNRLLLVGACYLRSRASKECLRGYVELFDQYRKYMFGRYRLWRLDLPDGMQPHLESGFARMEEGARDLLAALGASELSAVEQSLAVIKAGTELIQILLDREQEQERRLLEENSGHQIPLIGAELVLQLKEASQVERARWRRPVGYTLETLLPRLADHWAEMHPRLLIEEPDKERLSGELEHHLGRLAEVYAELLDESQQAEELLATAEAVMADLSECFARLQGAALDTGAMQDTVPGLYVEVCRGILGASVPDLTLENLLREYPPAGGAAHFEGYLESADPNRLVLGLKELLASHPEPVQGRPGSGWIV